MKTGLRTPRPWTAILRVMSRLGLRTLVLTILAVALVGPRLRRQPCRPPTVREAAAARLMDALDDKTRPVALAALNSAVLQFPLSERFEDTPPVENPAPVFVPLISMNRAVPGDRPFGVSLRGDMRTNFPRRASLSDDIIIVIRLADGTGPRPVRELASTLNCRDTDRSNAKAAPQCRDVPRTAQGWCQPTVDPVSRLL